MLSCAVALADPGYVRGSGKKNRHPWETVLKGAGLIRCPTRALRPRRRCGPARCWVGRGAHVPPFPPEVGRI